MNSSTGVHGLRQWFAAGICALAGAVAWADEPGPDLVVVPYDEAIPLAGQTATTYYLDGRTFERLWAEAGRPPRETPGLGGPGSALVEALHDAEWREEGIFVKARYRLYAGGSTWARVPFVFGGAIVKTTTVDGAPASYDQGDLLIKDRGWHVIETEYQVPEALNGREASWRVPSATAALLNVRGIGQVPVVNGGLAGVVLRAEPGFTVTTALGSREEIHLVVEGPARTPAVERPRLAKIESVLTASSGLRTLTSEVGWEFPGASLRTFTLDLEASYAPVRLLIPNLESWRLTRGGESRSRLEFSLNAPVTGGLKISLVAEKSAMTADGEESFPRIRPEASRIEETLVLSQSGRVEIETALSPAGQRIAIPERWRQRPEGERAVAAFQANGEAKGLPYAVRAMAVRDSVKADYVYQLETAGVNLFCRGDLRLASARKPFRIGLPTGAVIQQFVAGPDVSSWWQSGDELWLQGAGGRPQPTSFVLSLQFPPGSLKGPGGGLRLPELAWPTETEVTGEVLIASHSSAETHLTLGTPNVTRLLEPGSTLSGFSVLPPYQRGHAFAYRSPGFGAEVTSQEVTPVFDADWVLSAVVNETWVQLTFHLDVEVKRAALRQLVVKVAASIPELRWEGEALREVRAAVEGANRVYTLTFQEEVTGATGLVASTELPLVQGGARLPHLEVAGARQQTQFAVLENRTRGGLESNLARVEEVPRETLSYLPRKMNNPKFYRLTGPDWFLGVGLTKLENLGGMEMVITSSEIVTAIRDNGEEWYQVSYRMRNQSLQFLPVKLSKEMEVIKVRVAGREVQPKRGLETRKTETLLIALDPTRNEDLPFLVELIYRRPAGEETALGEHFRRSLEAPELDLEGRTEAQTFWRLYLPTGYTAQKVGGLVNQIPQRQRNQLMIDANLDELERLARRARTGAEPESGIAWRNVLGLAALTQEEGPFDGKEGRVSPEQARIRALAAEAAAFRPGVDLSVTVSAPGPELSTAANSGFAENSALVVERNRKLRDEARIRVDSVRDRIKLNDYVAADWKASSPGELPDVDAVIEESFEFGEAQTETASRLLEGWTLPGKPADRPGAGIPRFSLDPTSAPVPPVAPGAWVESVEQPRSLPDPNPEAVRARLAPGLDFPVIGEPLIFHKLKGNAELEIAGERATGRDLPVIWGWFLGALGVIQIIAHLTRPHRTAKA